MSHAHSRHPNFPKRAIINPLAVSLSLLFPFPPFLVNSSAATESMFGMIGSRDIDGPNKMDISPAVGEWRDRKGDSDISSFVRD